MDSFLVKENCRKIIMKFENFILTSNEIRLNTYTKFKKGNG